MTVPADATVSTQKMDPTDLVDWAANLRGPKPVLEIGENIASYEIAVTPEAAALGLSISQAVGRVPSDNGSVITFWLEFADPLDWADPLFDGNGAGVTLGIEITVTTNSTPSRRRQRTYGVLVRHQ